MGCVKKYIEQRDLSPKGRKRRREEKTVWNCEKCGFKLCSCPNRFKHGIHKSE